MTTIPCRIYLPRVIPNEAPPISQPRSVTKTRRAYTKPSLLGLHEAGRVGNQKSTLRELKKVSTNLKPLCSPLCCIPSSSTAQGGAFHSRKMAICKPLYNLAEHGQLVRTAHGLLKISCAGMKEGGVVASRASTMMPQGLKGAPASLYVSISGRSSLCVVFSL